MKAVIIEDKQRTESIILYCGACFVSITDLEGNPYVVPMNFDHKNGVIYLHSSPEGSRLEMLEHNNNICITFSVGHRLVYQREEVVCSYGMRSENTICRGRVEFIEEIDERCRALDITMCHCTDGEFNCSGPAVRSIKVWQVRTDQMTGKVFNLWANEKP